MTNKEMEDAIWADIGRLSELKSNYNCFDEKEEPYYRALSNAIQALREPISEWVPISKRLPDVSQRYLVYTKYDEVMTDYFMDKEFLQGKDIVAWMPLPKPYEKGGKEE